MNRYARFEWIVATRFLREGIMQTLLIVSGVALGVAVIVFMSALLTGLQSNLFRRTLNFQAQIVILPTEERARALRATPAAAIVEPRTQRLRSIDQWQKVRIAVEAMPGVTVVSPVVSGPGFVLRGNTNKAVNMTGMEPANYLRLIALAEKIVQGTAKLTVSDILIGTDLASDLGVSLGDKIALQTATGASAILTVCGIFDFGSKNQNQRAVYVAFRTAQSLLDLAGGATSIELNVSDPFTAETTAKMIEAQTGLEVDSWITTNAQFFSAMSAQSMSNSVIRFFVGLTAGLGIASVLVVSVVQKSKEIGILRATGTSRSQILRLFLLQGGLMGLMGSVLGSLLGWGFLSVWRGMARNVDGTALFDIHFEPQLFLYAASGATLVGIVAAVFPARRAAALDPAVAIRG